MHAMRLRKSSTAMGPQLPRQRWRPAAGALRGALLLLCLALLMHASVSPALARPVPSENGNVFYSLLVARQPEEGGVRSEEVVPMEQSPQPDSEATEDSLKQCGSLPDTTTEPCAGGFDRRILDEDYGSPGRNQDNHPAGPLP